MCVRLALLLALVLTVGMTRGAVAGLWVATPTPQPTGSISGMAIDDENGNGVIDPGEPGLAGWEIFLTTGEKAQVAAHGSYRFVGVPPGTYTVSLVAVIGGAGPPPPWIPTIPDASLRYEVSLAAGQNVENADFAIQLLDEAAVLWGEIIIDAAPAPDGTVVQALTGNTVCDEYTLGVGSSSGVWGPIIPPGRAPNTITMVVPSANEKAGCGTEGAAITFLINGRPANETEPWYSGSHSVWMLTTGPPFAWYSGGVPVDSDYKVAAYVGDTLCSNQFPRIGWSYAVAVFSAELKPGCGTPGATVRFMIGEAQAEETAQWSPGEHELNLTASAVAPSPTPTAVTSPIATPAATPVVTPVSTTTATAAPIATPSTSRPTLTPSPTRSPGASATSRPSGPGAGAGGSSSDDEADWWPFALAAGLVAALSGGGLLVWARRRARQPK